MKNIAGCISVLSAFSLAVMGVCAALPEELPFTFVYDGAPHRGVTGLDRLGADEYRLDDAVVIRVVRDHDAEFGEDEYTVWFENRGSAPSRVLKNVVCLDLSLAGENPLVRGILGDHGSRYRPYVKDLSLGRASFAVTEGRATHLNFPYFDLVHGDGGTMLALGWSGNWRADFAAEGRRPAREGRDGPRFRGRPAAGREGADRPGGAAALHRT